MEWWNITQIKNADDDGTNQLKQTEEKIRPAYLEEHKIRSKMGK